MQPFCKIARIVTTEAYCYNRCVPLQQMRTVTKMFTVTADAHSYNRCVELQQMRTVTKEGSSPTMKEVQLKSRNHERMQKADGDVHYHGIFRPVRGFM